MSKTRIFVEKPYCNSFDGVDELRQLIAKFGNRLHFAGKYSFARADILYPVLEKYGVPDKIVGNLIEGCEYFKYVKNRLEADGKHPYLIDGPELDLGFHLLDVITTFAIKMSQHFKYEGFELRDATDLSYIDSSFELGFAFESNLKLKLNGRNIPVLLRAGKGDVENNRSVEFHYGKTAIIQEYTSGVTEDPVKLITNGKEFVVTKHKQDYQCYAKELTAGNFCKQPLRVKEEKLKIMKLSIQMKNLRLGSSIN